MGTGVGRCVGHGLPREPPAPPIAKVALGEAVVELMPFDQGIVALGASGGLWRIEQPQGGVFSAAAISTHTALGRPVGLFSTGNGSKVGVFSPERLALLSRGASRLTVGIRRFADGIDKVVPLGAIPGKADSPLGLLTDAGDIWLVDAELKASSRVDLPGGSERRGGAGGWAAREPAGLDSRRQPVFDQQIVRCRRSPRPTSQRRLPALTLTIKSSWSTG